MQKSAIKQLKQLLMHQHLTIAVAEGLSCGWLQATLGSISGSSNYFLGGITVYNLEQKSKRLMIDQQLLEKDDCVSAEVALELAKGACRLFNSDFGIGTTGYAEVNQVKNVLKPMAYFAICQGDVFIDGAFITGDGLTRIEMQQKVAECSVLALINYLESMSR